MSQWLSDCQPIQPSDCQRRLAAGPALCRCTALLHCQRGNHRAVLWLHGNPPEANYVPPPAPHCTALHGQTSLQFTNGKRLHYSASLSDCPGKLKTEPQLSVWDLAFSLISGWPVDCAHHVVRLVNVNRLTFFHRSLTEEPLSGWPALESRELLIKLPPPC